MLVTVGNYHMNVADAAINLLAENPFKFPRPPEVPAIFFENGQKKPGMSFVYAMSYLFEKCGEFLIRRLMATEDVFIAREGIRRTVYMYPWEFTCLMIPKREVLSRSELDVLVTQKELWSTYFHLEITSASVKYREKVAQKP